MSKTRAEHVRGRGGCSVCCSMLRCWRLSYTCNKHSKGKTKFPVGKTQPDGDRLFVSAESWSVSIAIFMQFWQNILSHVNSGAAAHSTYRSVLILAKVNYVVIVSLPCHCWLLSAPRSAFPYISEKCFPPRHCACGHNLTQARSSRDTFAPLLKEAWQKAASRFSTNCGFEISGVYPCNLEKIPEEVFSVSNAVWIH